MSDVNLMADDQSECSHTPGPWWIQRRVGDALQVNAKHRGEGSSYCVAHINHWEGDADKANARLIAAAPELLHALRKFVEWQDEMKNAVPRIYIDRAKEAIAKAEGRS